MEAEAEAEAEAVAEAEAEAKAKAEAEAAGAEVAGEAPAEVEEEAKGRGVGVREGSRKDSQHNEAGGNAAQRALPRSSRRLPYSTARVYVTSQHVMSYLACYAMM